MAEKQIAATQNRAKLDHEKAREFIRLIPKGRWAAYGDVARAGGSPKGAMGVEGSWSAFAELAAIHDANRCGPEG